MARSVLLRDAHMPLGGRYGRVDGLEVVMDYAPLDQESALLAQVGLADWGFHGLFAVRPPCC
jgi:hypothetical protein